MAKGIKVNSEIGKLRKVLLHRPGEEVENLTPETFERLLFDDSMFLKIAREEHDAFAKVLKDNGVEVVYLEELTAKTLDLKKEIKDEFISQFIKEAGVYRKEIINSLTTYLNSIKSTKEMVDKTIAGIYWDEIKYDNKKHLADIINEYPFVTDPLPNVLFTRDNFASVGQCITQHKMFTVTRNREVLFSAFIFKYHPDYKETHKLYTRDLPYSIEGGDVLLLSKEILALGISQRTSAQAVEELAVNLFSSENKDKHAFKKILAFDIPKGREWMHLDTVFTQIDKDKFSVFSNYPFDVYEITDAGQGKVNIKKQTGDLDKILEKALGYKVKLFKTAKGHKVHAAREQWNDGANCLALSPNEIVVYSRNEITNKYLIEQGVKLHIIPSSELSRGRGGPRCMSMPLERDDI